jgi:hypothetical protein
LKKEAVARSHECLHKTDIFESQQSVCQQEFEQHTNFCNPCQPDSKSSLTQSVQCLWIFLIEINDRSSYTKTGKLTRELIFVRCLNPMQSIILMLESKNPRDVNIQLFV